MNMDPIFKDLNLHQFITGRFRELPRIDKSLERPPPQRLRTNPQIRAVRLTRHIQRGVPIKPV